MAWGDYLGISNSTGADVSNILCDPVLYVFKIGHDWLPMLVERTGNIEDGQECSHIHPY